MNKAGDFFKKLKNFIIKLIRFIPTVFGQICVWILIIILVLILIYVIIDVIASGIAEILGIDTAGMKDTTDYAILEQLTTSGYDVVMPADELQDYFAYEYAVLMDLARNLEEAGTYMPLQSDESPYDPAFLDRTQWAMVCADTFIFSTQQTNTPNIKASYAAHSTASKAAIEDGKAAAKRTTDRSVIASIMKTSYVASNNTSLAQAAQQGKTPSKLNIDIDAYIDTLVDQALAQTDLAKPSNEMSKEEIAYIENRSSTTGETSLVPYLIINRPVTIYTYQFEDKSLNIANGEASKDYNSIFRTTKGGGYTGKVNFNIPNDPNAEGFTYEYIDEYIYPLQSNQTLNANNIALFKKDPPGSNTPLDITETYSEGIHYAEKDNGTVEYHIPVKVLADRFMPKAVLLSSWYMLKQDETIADGEKLTAEMILEEIQDIYNKACLDGETAPESNWLLVKDVVAADVTTSNVDFKNIFKRKDFSSLNPLEEYAFLRNKNGDVVETELLYQKYNTDFESRELSNQQVVQAPQNQNQNQNQTPTQQPSLLTAYKQTFGGNLREDIIDDFELVLSHHNEVAYGFMNEKQYEKAIKDFERILEQAPLLEDAESNPGSLKEYIIYRTDSNGKYVINCKLLDEEKHHNAKNGAGTTHKNKYGHDHGTAECSEYMYNEDKGNHDDPYTDDKECFVPFIKIRFGRVKTDSRESVDATGAKIKTDVTVKCTAIVIIDENNQYAYRVDEKEIEDLAGLTNDVSFMKFDRFDAAMTNFSDWDEENSMDDAEERTYFIITDVFEAAPFSYGVTTNLNSYSRGHYSGQFDVDNDGDKDTVIDIGVTKARDTIKKDLLRKIDDYNAQNPGKLYTEIKDILKANGLDIDAELRNAGIEVYSGKELAIVRDQKDANGNFLPEALIPPTNAAPVDGSSAKPSYYKDSGESDWFENLTSGGIYFKLKNTDITTAANTVNSIQNRINNISGLNDALNDLMNNILNTDSYAQSHNVQWTSNSTGETKPVDRFGFDLNISLDKAASIVVYPVEMRVSTITQTVKHREMPMYLPRYAETWSSEKTMTNEVVTTGVFDPEFGAGSGGYFQLIPRAVTRQGIKDISVTISRKWRTGFYAPHFAKVRESDVLAMIAEWENAGSRDQFSAYTYIRDLYSLIQKSKTVLNDRGVAYVNENSYTYMYVPDEILYFDESVTDKAYWLERILATPAEDSIKYEENLTMRNKRNVKTWQIVDYEKYDECIEKDANGEPTGVVNVYGLWPLGGYFGRSLYAFEANSSESGNQKVLSWGAYTGPGVHSGVDLYGRGNALRVYTNAFDDDGNAKIKAKYNSDGTVTLTDGSNTIQIGDDNMTGDFGEESEGVGTEGAHNEGNISGNRNVGAYMSTTVPINIDGTKINFAGSSSAVYGYELYRLTKKYEDGEKAEAVIKESLEKEKYNTPVVAIAPGKVIGVKGGARPGFMVTIEHANGVTSSYLHMKRWPEVQVGEYVGAGTILGYEGTTGNSGGYHVHHEIHTLEGTRRYPIAQLYPFFTPFYYDAKTKDSDGNFVGIEDDYLSINRTIFPYGQITKGNENPRPYDVGGQSGEMMQVEDNEKGEILIKNYVPTKKLTTADQLYQSDIVDEAADLKKQIESDESISSEVIYNGEDVISLPQYFDKNFIKEVKGNNNHILLPVP